MRIYLDDIRIPKNPDKFTLIVRTAEHFKELMRKWGRHVEYVSLDHDLGTEEDGYDVARWMVNYHRIQGLNPRMVFNIHSANPVGAANMRATLGKFWREA